MTVKSVQSLPLKQGKHDVDTVYNLTSDTLWSNKVKNSSQTVMAEKLIHISQ